MKIGSEETELGKVVWIHMAPDNKKGRFVTQHLLGRPFSRVTTGQVHCSRDHFKEIFRLSRKCLTRNTKCFHKCSRSVARNSEESYGMLVRCPVDVLIG